MTLIKIDVLRWAGRQCSQPKPGPPCAVCADELVSGDNVGMIGQQMVCLSCMKLGYVGQTAKIFYEGWDDLQLSGVGIIAAREDKDE